MLKKLTQADRQIFTELSREFYSSPAVLHPVPESFHERVFDEIMRSEDYLICRLFCVDGEKAGYGLLSKSFSPEVGGPIIWVEEIYLREQARGQGVGSEFLHFAQSLGAARVRLELCPDNTRARRLYEREGFSELGYVQMTKDF